MNHREIILAMMPVYDCLYNRQILHQEGMDVIVIVGSSGGFPHWAIDLLQEPAPMSEIVINGENTKIPSKMKKEDFIKFVRKHKIPVRNVVEKNGYVILEYIPIQGFLDEAKKYASKITQELGDEIYYYQLSNEFNHLSDLIDTDHDADYIKALHDGIVQHDHSYKTIVNVFVDANCELTWRSQLRDLLNKAGECADIIAIDHYPGTWSDENYDHWSELDALFEIADEYGEQAAVMETGYTTYKYGGLPVTIADIPHNETKQHNFINTAIPAIKEKANQHELLFVTWYELIDEPNAGPLPAEKEFGIIHSDFTPKLGYNDLKYQFETIQYFVNITSPTQSNPADAGYYNSPISISIVVEVKDNGNSVSGLTKDDFTFIIGSKVADNEYTELLSSSNGVYTFLVLSPIQDSPGLYDLTVEVSYKGYIIKDTEKKAVEYKSCPAGEAMYRSGVSDPEGKLNVLRELRDKQLNRKYVSLYYKYCPEIRDVVISDLKLVMDMSSMIVKYLPAIKHSLREGGGDVFVTKQDVVKAISIIDRIEKGIKAKKISSVKKREIIRLLEELKWQIKNAEGKMFGKAFRESVYCKWHRSFRIDIGGEYEKN